MVLKKLLKKLGRLKDPRQHTLEEWVEHHRPRVERDVAKVLPHVPEDGRFVDIGANVGLFTECLLGHRPGCEAVLFEPVREYYEHCRARFADNPRVQVYPYGIGPEPGLFTIHKAEYNPGGNSLVEEIVYDQRDNSITTKDSVYSTEEVELVDFSAFAREHGITDVDFIKTDTEAYDYAVLQSMLPWLREQARLPVILSELLSPDYHTRADLQAAAVAAMADAGYQRVELPHEPKVFDVLFLPRDPDAG